MKTIYFSYDIKMLFPTKIWIQKSWQAGKFYDYDNNFIIVKETSLGILNAFTHTFDNLESNWWCRN